MAFTHEPFPMEAVQFVALSHRVQRVAHYMAAMGLWCPPCTKGIPGPLPSSSCKCLHDVFGLFSGPSKVNDADLGSVIFPPRGEKRGVVGIYILCSYITTRSDY